MLNCTDLACVLHHHHFYAHLHHLKHHLQDDNENSGLGDGSELSNNDNIQTNTNETDAPNEVIYMVSGVLIAMLMVGLIIILVAVTINKLRKREDSTTPTSPTALEAQQSNFGSLQQQSRSINVVENNNCERQFYDQQQIFTTTTTTNINNNNNNNNSNNNSNNNNSDSNNTTQDVTYTRTSGIGVTASNGWVFPPKAPTPNIYNCITNDALIAANDRNGFKGFRKQFSGRFKRLVSKKVEPTSPIPPELKPQLKTIYVY